MTLQQRFHLGEVHRFGAFLWKRHVDIAVNQNNEAHFPSEVEKFIQRWIRKAGSLTRNL